MTLIIPMGYVERNRRENPALADLSHYTHFWGDDAISYFLDARSVILSWRKRKNALMENVILAN